MRSYFKNLEINFCWFTYNRKNESFLKKSLSTKIKVLILLIKLSKKFNAFIFLNFRN